VKAGGGGGGAGTQLAATVAVQGGSNTCIPLWQLQVPCAQVWVLKQSACTHPSLSNPSQCHLVALPAHDGRWCQAAAIALRSTVEFIPPQAAGVSQLATPLVMECCCPVHTHQRRCSEGACPEFTCMCRQGCRCGGLASGWGVAVGFATASGPVTAGHLTTAGAACSPRVGENRCSKASRDCTGLLSAAARGATLVVSMGLFKCGCCQLLSRDVEGASWRPPT
jgi:hypothetical protein